MENEKKASRLGVRLSALMIAALLVVCMAVPAFALTVDVDAVGGFPSVYLPLPDGTKYYFLVPSNSGYKAYAFVSIPSQTRFYVSSGRLSVSANRYECIISSSGAVGEWTYYDLNASTSFNLNLDLKEYFVGNFEVYNQDGSIFYAPPPPDLNENVTSGLTIVLDWVGATVSALFSGELAGLLPLVAVPVAITLLLVAIIVIKRSIWGA